MNEAFFTGKSALKEGEALKRGKETNKTKVLIAVSGTSDGIPQYVRMKIIPNFKAKTIEVLCSKYIRKGSTLVTDGFKAYQSQCEGFRPWLIPWVGKARATVLSGRIQLSLQPKEHEALDARQAFGFNPCNASCLILRS